ncbi:hypothetical protein BDW62DRAFT_85881 [Aspergillus aurantiobrunneus]
MVLQFLLPRSVSVIVPVVVAQLSTSAKLVVALWGLLSHRGLTGVSATLCYHAVYSGRQFIITSTLYCKKERRLGTSKTDKSSCSSDLVFSVVNGYHTVGRANRFVLWLVRDNSGILRRCSTSRRRGGRRSI